MSYYITQASLITRFGTERITQLADRAGDGTIDADVVTAAIDDAEATIDGLLGGRYDLDSLHAVDPPLVVSIALDLALVALAKGHNEQLIDADSGFRRQYEDAMALLGQIARGEISIGVDTVAEETRVQIESNDRVFTRATLRGY